LSAPGFSRMVERAAVSARLGIKAHAHMLRHACGCKLANDGHDTRSLQAYDGSRYCSFERVSTNVGLNFRENFAGQRQRRRKGPSHSTDRQQRQKSRTKNQKFGAICTTPGNLCLYGTAWWTWEDSNFQPIDYRPLAPSVSSRLRAALAITHNPCMSIRTCIDPARLLHKRLHPSSRLLTTSDISQRSRPFADRLVICTVATGAANNCNKRICVLVEWDIGKFEREPSQRFDPSS
jgi:hypothetical protein